MGNLEGKVAFITGAARGQGRSHAVRLARDGADIIAVDICDQIATVAYPMATPEDLQSTVEHVEEMDRRIVAVQADVRDRAGLERALAAGLASLGRVDIIVANAGIAPIAGTDADDEVAWADVNEVNMGGAWRTVKVVAPQIIKQGEGGAVVLTSSTAGLKALGSGDVGTEGYVASKHAVVGLMRSFAKWLAPYRIRVNSVHPTGVNTPMVVNDFLQARLEEIGATEVLTNLLPVQLIEPEDVSNAVAWLVSEEARYVTGVTLPIDAGFTIM